MPKTCAVPRGEADMAGSGVSHVHAKRRGEAQGEAQGRSAHGTSGRAPWGIRQHPCVRKAQLIGNDRSRNGAPADLCGALLLDHAQFD